MQTQGSTCKENKEEEVNLSSTQREFDANQCNYWLVSERIPRTPSNQIMYGVLILFTQSFM
jgi:hypothetical protein